MSGSPQVLESDEGSLNTCDLVTLGVAAGEGEGDAGVVDDLLGVDVLGQSFDKVGLDSEAQNEVVSW